SHAPLCSDPAKKETGAHRSLGCRIGLRLLGSVSLFPLRGVALCVPAFAGRERRSTESSAPGQFLSALGRRRSYPGIIVADDFVGAAMAATSDGLEYGPPLPSSRLPRRMEQRWDCVRFGQRSLRLQRGGSTVERGMDGGA